MFIVVCSCYMQYNTFSNCYQWSRSSGWWSVIHKQASFIDKLDLPRVKLVVHAQYYSIRLKYCEVSEPSIKYYSAFIIRGFCHLYRFWIQKRISTGTRRSRMEEMDLFQKITSRWNLMSKLALWFLEAPSDTSMVVPGIWEKVFLVTGRHAKFRAIPIWGRKFISALCSAALSWALPSFLSSHWKSQRTKSNQTKTSCWLQKTKHVCINYLFQQKRVSELPADFKALAMWNCLFQPKGASVETSETLLGSATVHVLVLYSDLCRWSIIS